MIDNWKSEKKKSQKKGKKTKRGKLQLKPLDFGGFFLLGLCFKHISKSEEKPAHLPCDISRISSAE